MELQQWPENLNSPQTRSRVNAIRRIVTEAACPNHFRLSSGSIVRAVACAASPPLSGTTLKASGIRRYGNQWIDWSSGVLITNPPRGREIIDAIVKQASRSC